MDANPAIRSASDDRDLLQRFAAVRSNSLALVAPLSAEDAGAQSMPDASPAKWHLAHTTWFFERFVLTEAGDYRPWREGWDFLFNSYYEAVGPRHPRPERGLLTRPGLDEVLEYRRVIDERMQALLQTEQGESMRSRIALGLQHEQQHQELLLTDILHLLSCNPLQPAYRDDLPQPPRGDALPLRWLDGITDVVEVGHDGNGFAFDCELPRHRQLLTRHAIAQRPVNNGEYREFVRDGGYRRPELWLSDGWATVQREGWQAPLYWQDDLDSAFTLGGVRALDPLAPVCHVSFFEADAFARWAGARLSREAEWEAVAADVDPSAGNDGGRGLLQPQAPRAGDGFLQLFGDVWEWTASPYVAYPGFCAVDGALGEYNGKFMCGQFVLRGGSCVTPAGHLRASYRNFFYPKDRWQFSGIRLAQDR